MASGNEAPTTSSGGAEVKKTLSTTGVTINAMALIAPGAFLWITFQLQAAGSDPKGNSTAFDMWQGIVFALLVAFLTALSYAEMAKIYPEAGYGSAYYFAEKTFADKVSAAHQKWARLAKLVTGWAAHLFYWVYPGVMVSFMAILISYIAGLFGAKDGSGNPGLPLQVNIGVAVVFAIVCGAIAVRGIQGSTLTSWIVNIVQLVTLVLFSFMAIAYRMINPQHAHFAPPPGGDVNSFGHASISSIIVPHSMQNVLFQATIAILILVGFESCTALGAEAKDARKSVPLGVIWSLIIQGLFAYLLEYFAANYAISDKLTYLDGKNTLTGMAAAAKSQAPIGDLMQLMGDSLLHGAGKALTITMAITVAAAILGTTLACLNTAVRVSYAMAKDKEMPELMGLMHGKFATPHTAVWILTIVSAIIGGIGVWNTVVQTGIGMASNLGTFILYMLICIWTIIAFNGRKEKNHFLHMLIPILGFIANAVMISTIFYLAFASGGDSAKEGWIALGFAAVWGVLSLIYILISNARSGRKLISASEAS
jgi:APA family basic amino acid/polyamine antiporter